MICALVLDLGHPREFPVTRNVLGRALAVYPFMAAKASHHVDRAFLATDSQEVKALALQYETHILAPADQDAPQGVEASLRHAFAQVVSELKKESETLELLALMFTHVPTVIGETIDSGVEALQARPDADCAASVSRYNQWNPYDARRESKDGWLEPFAVPEENRRDEVWFPDWGVFILRPGWLDTPAKAGARLAWLGKKPLAVKQWGGGPVDFDWQVPQTEHWLKKHGIPDLSPNMEMQPLPKPQAAPKGDRR